MNTRLTSGATTVESAACARTVTQPAPLVVFLTSWYSSHVLSAIGLARRIRRAGWDVEFWADRNARQLVTDQGFAFRELKSVWHCYEPWLPGGPAASTPAPLLLLQAFRAARNRRRAMRPALSLFERSLERALASRTPVLVVFDPFVAVYHAYMRRLGINCVVLGDKLPPIPGRSSPPPTSSLVPRPTRVSHAMVGASWWALRVKDRLRRGFVSSVLGLCGAYTTEELVAAVRRRTGYPPPGDRVHRGPAYDLHFRSIDEWVFGQPEIDWTRDAALPANVRYVGLCVDAERVERGVRIARSPEAQYLVYVSMGTAMPRWSSDLRSLDRILRALRALPDTQIVVATGNRRAAEALLETHAGASNVQVYESVAQLAALKLADLVVTHAGANTFRECIATCTPMLAFPRDYDQRGNAARIVHLGIGLTASRSIDTVAQIRRKALRLLTDSRYGDRVRELSELCRAREARLLEEELARHLPARSEERCC